MANAERISSQKLVKVFRQLQKEGTALKINLIGQGYERLTIITGTEIRNGTSYLLIDYPQGFRESIRKSENGRILFEFNDKNNIPYIFRTNVSKVPGENIWIRFPESIERIQRRKFFRVAPTLGSQIQFSVEGKAFEMTVINISEGGALASQKQRYHENASLGEGTSVKHLNLICLGKTIKRDVTIKKAVIKRVKKEVSLGTFHYAFQFLDLEKTEIVKLRDFIVSCQRELLKKRSMIADT